MRVRVLTVAVVAALAALALAACAEESNPEDFADFADNIARAARDNDVEFFQERVRGEPRTCSEEDVEAAMQPDAPPDPVCTEAGIRYEAVIVQNYGAAGAIATPDVVQRDIQRFFDQQLPQVEDDYGPGSVRLYATAMPLRADETGEELHTAILTALHEFQNMPVRVVRGIDFAFVDGEWVIRGITTATFPIAVELLEARSAAVLYRDWQAYE